MLALISYETAMTLTISIVIFMAVCLSSMAVGFLLAGIYALLKIGYDHWRSRYDRLNFEKWHSELADYFKEVHNQRHRYKKE